MKWKEAELNLGEIRKHIHLDTRGEYKYVCEIPPYHCKKYNCEGFKIQVGKDSFINIPISMLESIFNATCINHGIYDRHIIENLFPTEVLNKPCYVHSVGRLFVEAGVMILKDKRTYEIL